MAPALPPLMAPDGPCIAAPALPLHSPEEKIAELQKQKRELADAILEGDETSNVLQNLSVEDLELLFS